MVKTVYTFVVADLFHINHLKFLKLAKTYGDKLIVGVLSDYAVKSYKRTPIYNVQDRMAIVENIRCVDEVVIQNSKSPLDNIINIHPDIIVHADDWKGKFPDEDEIRSLGVDIIFTPYFDGITTTSIIKKCQSLEKHKKSII